MSEPKLKPCPFCGYRPAPADIIELASRLYSAYCAGCGAEGPETLSIVKAHKLWNRRVREARRG